MLLAAFASLFFLYLFISLSVFLSIGIIYIFDSTIGKCMLCIPRCTSIVLSLPCPLFCPFVMLPVLLSGPIFCCLLFSGPSMLLSFDAAVSNTNNTHNAVSILLLLSLFSLFCCRPLFQYSIFYVCLCKGTNIYTTTIIYITVCI